MRPTVNQLKESVHYDPKTGLFSRKWKTRPTFEHIGSKKKHGYIVFQVCGHRDYAHRFAWLYMTGKWPKELDHINGDRGDNRWLNLRRATRTQNNGNRKLCNKKKYHHLPKGVLLRKNRGGSIGYMARINYKNRQIHISTHKTMEEAHAAYMAMAKKLFGDFARGE